MACISFGKHKRVKYNTKSHCLCPRDCRFVFVTLALILVPTGGSYFLIVTNEQLPLWATIVLGIV